MKIVVNELTNKVKNLNTVYPSNNSAKLSKIFKAVSEVKTHIHSDLEKFKNHISLNYVAKSDFVQINKLLNEKINSIKNETDNRLKQLKLDTDTRLEKLCKDLESLKNDDRQLACENKVTHESPPNLLNLEDMFSEMQKRHVNINNIILHNLPESVDLEEAA